MSHLRCVACGDLFEDAPEGEGIVFDPAAILVPICKQCCRKIAKRYAQKWPDVIVPRFEI